MNGWFPRLRADGVMASGNTSVWLTALDGTARELGVGGWPVWAGQSLIYNRRDGTTQAGPLTLAQEYSEYVGSDVGQWAGAVGGNPGRVDRYAFNIGNTAQCTLIAFVTAACLPRFCGAQFGYLTPYQADAVGHVRTLMLDDRPVAKDTIIDWCANKGGGCYLYTVSRPTGKQIFDQRGNNVTIRPQQDEQPWAVFMGPDPDNPKNSLPWIASWVGGEHPKTFVRMLYASNGYAWDGDFLNADCRTIGARAHLVGSTSAGVLREAWIDFNAPKVDLREA